MRSVRTIKLQKLGPFSDLELDFADGINVFIGSNGSGKSQLLKLIYSVLKVHEEELPIFGQTGQQAKLAQKLVSVFQPADQALGRIVQRNVGRSSAAINMNGDSEETIAFRVTTPGNLHIDRDSLTRTDSAIFIPSREALSMFEGFIQAYQSRELSFDETYYDLCVALSGAALRGPRLAQARHLVEPLERTIGGRVALSGSRFIVESSEGNLEAHLLAEGWRKLGELAHLVLNGTLGANTFLFWDEPEANLNPRLVVLVKEMLERLAAAGVQIFVASHDYLLTNELSLGASDPDRDFSTRFFSLERDDGSGEIVAEDASTLDGIRRNSILDEFAAHYDREVSQIEGR
jgi:ABC-type ATPase involved in cell division